MSTIQSVWNMMTALSKMSKGGIIITSDNKYECETAKIVDDNVSINNGDIVVPLLSVKEARPLHLDYELPTKRDDEPADDKDDEEPEGEIEKLSSRDDYFSCDSVFDEPPSNLVRCFGDDTITTYKKRKLDEETPTEQNTPVLKPSENLLLQYPRPEFLEPLPVSPRNKTLEQYNKLEDEYIKLVKFTIENNYNIIKDAYTFDYELKIKTTIDGTRVYKIVYTFEDEGEYYAIVSCENILGHIKVKRCR